MQDFLTDVEGNFIIEDGDLKVGDAEAQHIQDIVESFRGEWKQYPTVGCGLRDHVNGPMDEDEIRRNIQVQLEADGFVNVKVQKIGDEFYVNAERP